MITVMEEDLTKKCIFVIMTEMQLKDSTVGNLDY